MRIYPIRELPWVNCHGLALKVSNDLSGFNRIIPCGTPGLGFTLIEKELGKPVNMGEVKERIGSRFTETFEIVKQHWERNERIQRKAPRLACPAAV